MTKIRGLLLYLSGLLLGGCGLFPEGVEVCYVHPVYGQVCVKVGGKNHYREDLTPEERAAAEKWVKGQEALR